MDAVVEREAIGDGVKRAVALVSAEADCEAEEDRDRVGEDVGCPEAEATDGD